MIKNKNILIGITGGIAAYKTAILIRLLVKQGASVKVVMTDNAKRFITPLTIATLSNNPILTEFFDPENGEWNNHVSLGMWADIFVVAPATANTIAKMANGIADNLLTTCYLSAKCPIVVAPAMDMDMFAHAATQNNIETLRQRGNLIIEPSIGELASGLEGKGRMAEPEMIVSTIEEVLSKKKEFFRSKIVKKRLLINAGPTQEAIDPVRFISNRSSGKMGIALAEVAAEIGFDVTLVLGPVAKKPSSKNIKIIDVVTASEMSEACTALFRSCDAAILAAAVADFSPTTTIDKKIKKTDNIYSIELKPTTDIAEELGKKKREGQLLVGFALETDNEVENAVEKLKRKHFDFIVLNSLKDKDACFGNDTNKVTIIDSKGTINVGELKSKREVALDILEKLLDYNR